jgi:Cobalamin biosynthesis protein CobT (nicotinate-mononucleotide:5, 6-dimethylbenzimidazole phosphoribosyltransferase)
MLKNSLSILFTLFFFVFMVSCGGDATKITKSGDETGDEQDTSSDDSDSGNSDNETTDTEPADENPDGENNQTDPNENQGNNNENPDENSEDPIKETTTTVEPSSDFETKTEALIVTTADFEEVFKKFADFHTVTGINTKVVTLENICENTVCDDSDPLNDTQKAIKDYVMSVEGLKYLVLGGDIENIPSRQVHDKFKIELIADYEEDFYSDLYYADFSDWDLNGNGVYAEDEDVPGLIANVAVGRISVSTVDEAELYFSKIVKHHTAFNTAYTTKSLLLANIATEISGIKVNSGYYFETEGKTASLIPANYSIKRLYTKSTPSPSKEALPLDNESEKAAIEEGMNLIVHSGHGAPWLLTCEQGDDPDRDFDRNMAYNLKNATLPFFLSCACEAGQFGYKNGDSAGEKLMNAPEGGAIVYLGNTTTGLGIAGGSQFIDEMMKNMFAFPYSVIGESYLYAHFNMPQSDTFNPPIQMVNINVPVVNKDSWTWTKKTIVMLGDPMTVFWRDPVEPFAAEIEPEVEENEGVKTISLNFTPDLEGAMLRVLAGGKLYDIPYLMHETVKINIDSTVETITVGIKAENSQYFFKEFEL